MVILRLLSYKAVLGWITLQIHVLLAQSSSSSHSCVDPSVEWVWVTAEGPLAGLYKRDPMTSDFRREETVYGVGQVIVTLVEPCSPHKLLNVSINETFEYITDFNFEPFTGCSCTLLSVSGVDEYSGTYKLENNTEEDSFDQTWILQQNGDPKNQRKSCTEVILEITVSAIEALKNMINSSVLSQEQQVLVREMVEMSLKLPIVESQHSTNTPKGNPGADTLKESAKITRNTNKDIKNLSINRNTQGNNGNARVTFQSKNSHFPFGNINTEKLQEWSKPSEEEIQRLISEHSRERENDSIYFDGNEYETHTVKKYKELINILTNTTIDIEELMLKLDETLNNHSYSTLRNSISKVVLTRQPILDTWKIESGGDLIAISEVGSSCPDKLQPESVWWQAEPLELKYPDEHCNNQPIAPPQSHQLAALNQYSTEHQSNERGYTTQGYHQENDRMSLGYQQDWNQLEMLERHIRKVENRQKVRGKRTVDETHDRNQTEIKVSVTCIG